MYWDLGYIQVRTHLVRIYLGEICPWSQRFRAQVRTKAHQAMEVSQRLSKAILERKGCMCHPTAPRSLVLTEWRQGRTLEAGTKADRGGMLSVSVPTACLAWFYITQNHLSSGLDPPTSVINQENDCSWASLKEAALHLRSLFPKLP